MLKVLLICMLIMIVICQQQISFKGKKQKKKKKFYNFMVIVFWSSRLVDDLSRIAQGRQAIELGATPNQEKSMRIRGLECLVSILKCMVEWSKDLYVNPNSQTNLGPERNVREYDANEFVANQDSLNSLDGSESSLTSNSSGNKESPDMPQQLQVLKHQKEVWETGILM